MEDDASQSQSEIKSNLIQIEVARHVGQLRKRNVPNAFGGPDPSWCDASSHLGIELPVNPNDKYGPLLKFTGCLKYATCDLIPDDARWKKWEEIEEAKQKELTHCQNRTLFFLLFRALRQVYRGCFISKHCS